MKKRLTSLSLKVNLLLIAIILTISFGMMATAYHVYSKRVDNFYFDRISQASQAASEIIPGIMVTNFWDEINTDEFRQIRREAIDADDEKIIENWMESKPSLYQKFASEGEAADPDYWSSLKDDYDNMLYVLSENIKLFDVKQTSIQLDVNNVTYNLIAPSEKMFVIGSIEPSIEDFASYGDNDAIPPTVYHSQYGWLCSTCTPIIGYKTDGSTKYVAGLVCVDIDMNDVMSDRYEFLRNCIVFVLIQLAIANLAGMFLMRRMVTRPLVSLSQATMSFVKSDEGYSRADIIDLPIRSRDEIGDLYREIRDMQGRIVDYTDHLAVATAERERVNTELSIATGIQANMLPNIFPPFPERPEFDLFASMDPAKEVGGDFYDFVLVDDDHLVFLIADVSDKGVPAALFMMSAKIIINYCARMGGTPGEILTAANAQLCRNNTTKMFVTVWLGLLELSTGKLTCTNAGHEYPIVRGQDGVFQVYKDKHGLVVGALTRAKYRDYELQLHPGDAIFVYTDGVPEANNATSELFGMERMLATLNRVAGESPRGILAGVRKDVDAFVAGAKQFDDLTMLCLEYKGPV